MALSVYKLSLIWRNGQATNCWDSLVDKLEHLLEQVERTARSLDVQGLLLIGRRLDQLPQLLYQFVADVDVQQP